MIRTQQITESTRPTASEDGSAVGLARDCEVPPCLSSQHRPAAGTAAGAVPEFFRCTRCSWEGQYPLLFDACPECLWPETQKVPACCDCLTAIAELGDERCGPCSAQCEREAQQTRSLAARELRSTLIDITLAQRGAA